MWETLKHTLYTGFVLSAYKEKIHNASLHELQYNSLNHSHEVIKIIMPRNKSLSLSIRRLLTYYRRRCAKNDTSGDTL